MRELRQKKWPDYTYYRIEEKGVFVEMKRSGQLTSRLVHYDEFGTDTSINSESPSPWAIGILFLLFLQFGFRVFMAASKF